MIKKIVYTLLLLAFLIPNLQSQDLYDLETLRSIHIDFENPDWHNILVNSWYAQTGHRELATLEMDGTNYDSVAIRYKGNATFFLAEDTDNPKIPLNIDMDDEIPGQDLLGFNKVKLANSLFDPSVLRDVLGFQIYRNYMPAPQANWMKVYIEGEYIGIYPNTESINKQFLDKHFDNKNGVFFKCDPASQFGSPDPWLSPDLGWYGPDSSLYYNRYQIKSDHGWAELVNLIDILNNNPDELPTVLNIDRVLWNLAVSTAIANYDAYNGFYIHNYYLYQHENGLFQMLPWDLSETFVGILLGTGNLTEDQIYNWDIFLENDPFGENRPLLDFVADHPIYRKQFLAHIRTVMEEILNADDLLSNMQDMQAIIAVAMAEDDNAFFGLGNFFFQSNLTTDVNSFGIKVAGITSAMTKRKDYLSGHPELSLSPPVISEVSHSPESPGGGEIVAVTALIDNGDQVDLMVTNNKYASHFQAVSMLDDGMHEDGIAGDGIFGAFVPFTEAEEEIRYYIRAQNDDAMQLHPQRAEYEFHEYTIGQSTGVANPEFATLQIELSPNPSNGLFHIQTQKANFNQELNLNIYNAAGILVKTEKASFLNSRFDLDMIGFERGLYFVKIKGFEAKKVLLL